MTNRKAEVQERILHDQILELQVEDLNDQYCNAFRQIEQLQAEQLAAAKEFNEKTRQMFELTMSTVSAEKESLENLNKCLPKMQQVNQKLDAANVEMDHLTQKELGCQCVAPIIVIVIAIIALFVIIFIKI